MSLNLPVQLHLLIPIADNVISGDSFKPGDVITTRSGLTVEVGNTDAEGRLVLGEAITAACEHSPELIIDFSSLTGAARVALGPEIPAFFSNNPNISLALQENSQKTCDPLWQLPLYQPYREYFRSEIADLNNCSTNAFAGAITAALFLESFVARQTSWIHMDISAWNFYPKPGRPIGGEAMTIRAVWEYLKERYRG